MEKLNFTTRVLGQEAAARLRAHQVTQTIRASHSDIVQGVLGGQLRAGDIIDVALDGKSVGSACLIGGQPVPAAGLTDEDAHRGGFNTREKLEADLKRAGYRFRPLMDYTFYRVQFGWR